MSRDRELTVTLEKSYDPNLLGVTLSVEIREGHIDFCHEGQKLGFVGVGLAGSIIFSDLRDGSETCYVDYSIKPSELQKLWMRLFDVDPKEVGEDAEATDA